MPSGGSRRITVCLDGEIYASMRDAQLALGVGHERLLKMIEAEGRVTQAFGWPRWFPRPLEPEHRKRLEAWARTLQGVKHTPWRTEAAQAREAAASRGGYASRGAKA